MWAVVARDGLGMIELGRYSTKDKALDIADHFSEGNDEENGLIEVMEIV